MSLRIEMKQQHLSRMNGKDSGDPVIESHTVTTIRLPYESGDREQVAVYKWDEIGPLTVTKERRSEHSIVDDIIELEGDVVRGRHLIELVEGVGVIPISEDTTLTVRDGHYDTTRDIKRGHHRNHI